MARRRPTWRGSHVKATKNMMQDLDGSAREGIQSEDSFASHCGLPSRRADSCNLRQPPAAILPNYFLPAWLGDGVATGGNASVASGSTRGRYPVRVRILYFFSFLPVTFIVILRHPWFGLGAG